MLFMESVPLLQTLKNVTTCGDLYRLPLGAKSTVTLNNLNSLPVSVVTVSIRKQKQTYTVQLTYIDNITTKDNVQFSDNLKINDATT